VGAGGVGRKPNFPLHERVARKDRFPHHIWLIPRFEKYPLLRGSEGLIATAVVTIKGNPNACCGSLAEILDGDFGSEHKPVFRKSSRIYEFNIVDRQPCSPTSNKTLSAYPIGFRDDGYLPLASAPEPMGREPKADGGKGENNRERADDAFIVPIKEGVGLFEGERRTHVEGGAVFFIIVIGGLLIVRRLYEAQR
jgi:hypothetical protein